MWISYTNHIDKQWYRKDRSASSDKAERKAAKTA